eukprot:5902471-Amphidinium_carterae.1
MTSRQASSLLKLYQGFVSWAHSKHADRSKRYPFCHRCPNRTLQKGLPRTPGQQLATLSNPFQSQTLGTTNPHRTQWIHQGHDCFL